MLLCVSTAVQVVFEHFNSHTQQPPFAWNDESVLSTHVICPGQINVVTLSTAQSVQRACLDLFRRVKGHPDREFVLVCQASTTEEEVLLFLYRDVRSSTVYSMRTE